MKPEFSLPSLIKDKKLAQDAQALYLFFTEAEANGTRFTYAAIHDHFPRSPSNISKYARNYWSWFLRREPEKMGRANTFSCHGLKDYPAFYFVMAHQRNQGQYYRHFSEALLKAKERDQARRIKPQEITEASPSPSPNVPGQQDPEELHIEELPPDEDVEEDEMETERPQDLDEGVPQEDDSETSSETAQRKGGVNFMSIFTLDKQLEQIRAEFTQKMDLLEQKLINEVRRQGEAQQSRVPPEVSQVLKVLEQLQEQAPVFSSLASQASLLLEKQGEITTGIQALEQTLLGGMQQLRILTAQLPEKLEQTHKQIQESLLSLAEQLEHLQGQASNLSVSAVSTPTKLEQLQTKIDELFSQLAQETLLVPLLQELQRQIAEIAQLSSIPSILEQLQGQLDGVSSQVASASRTFDVLQQVNERLKVEIVPAIPSGEQKPDDYIHTSLQKTIEAINTLGQGLTTWLDQHYLVLWQSKQASAEKLIQDLTSSVRAHMAGKQDGIPLPAEALLLEEQNIPLINQPSETDAVHDTKEPHEENSGQEEQENG